MGVGWAGPEDSDLLGLPGLEEFGLCPQDTREPKKDFLLRRGLFRVSLRKISLGRWEKVVGKGGAEVSLLACLGGINPEPKGLTMGLHDGHPRIQLFYEPTNSRAWDGVGWGPTLVPAVKQGP